MTSNEQSPEAPLDSEDMGQASPILIAFLLIPLLGILAALLMLVNQIRLDRANLSNQDDIPNPLALTDSAAPDFELPDLAGDLVSLSDYQGKILFLNFWQTTCPPCVRELPDFVAFIEEQEDDVTWLTVNVAETSELVQAFFTAYSFTDIPVVLDIDSSVRNRYSVIGFPITYVLDAEGIIRHTSIGALTYEQMNDILDDVRGGV